jgi:uncharacterized protein (DUF2141 family)
MLKGKVIVAIFFMIFIKNINADIPFVIEINNITIDEGAIYVGIFINEESYKNNTPEKFIKIEPVNIIVRHEIQMTGGEYVIGIHQDTNGNGIMDYGIFGIPKEPYGVSNMAGKIPGNYNSLKFRVDDYNKTIIISLVRF